MKGMADVISRVEKLEKNLEFYYLKEYEIEKSLKEILENRHFTFYIQLGGKRGYFEEAFLELLNRVKPGYIRMNDDRSFNFLQSLAFKEMEMIIETSVVLIFEKLYPIIYTKRPLNANGFLDFIDNISSDDVNQICQYLPKNNNIIRINMMLSHGLRGLVRLKAFKIAKTFFDNYFSLNDLASDELEYYNGCQYALEISPENLTMDAINHNWEKLPMLLALVFKKSPRDNLGIEPALLQLDVFILKCNNLFTLLNKQKPFFKYLCEKSSSYFEILGNQIDFSQTKMEPTVINDLRAIKNKLDFIFEKQIELVRGNETNRFIFKKNFIRLVSRINNWCWLT